MSELQKLQINADGETYEIYIELKLTPLSLNLPIKKQVSVGVQKELVISVLLTCKKSVKRFEDMLPMF